MDEGGEVILVVGGAVQEVEGEGEDNYLWRGVVGSVIMIIIIIIIIKIIATTIKIICSSIITSATIIITITTTTTTTTAMHLTHRTQRPILYGGGSMEQHTQFKVLNLRIALA